MGRFSAIAGVPLDPSTDIPQLSGKTILVTGASSGIGLETVKQLARHGPSHMWLAARSVEKAKAAVEEVKLEAESVDLKPLEMDLSSFNSIKNAAAAFRLLSDRLDILILNAGIMATPEGTTIDGYEVQFGTNYMGHVLFLELLKPILEKPSDIGAPARVVWLGSAAHSNAPAEGIRFDTLKGTASEMSTWTRYGQSKLASIFFWLRTLKRVASIFLLSGEDGAENTLWAATSNSVVSGEYYEPIGVAGQGSPQTKDLKLEEEVWNWTQNEMKPHLP